MDSGVGFGRGFVATEPAMGTAGAAAALEADVTVDEVFGSLLTNLAEQW